MKRVMEDLVVDCPGGRDAVARERGVNGEDGAAGAQSAGEGGGPFERLVRLG